jgi:glucosamine-6-phosphate deaminase
LFVDITFAQLDEILDTSSVASNFSAEIHKSLLSKLKGGYAGFIGIKGLALNPFSEAERHYQNILQAGGWGVQLLGIGINGHVGFNEPDSNKNSICRVTNLAKSTIERNGYDPSARAITLGIADILNARRLVLLATGEAKASAISSMINAPKSANNPAGLLRYHPYILLFLDKAAASHLNE